MIQLQTISSLTMPHEDKVPEAGSAPSSQTSSVQDAVVPSTFAAQSKKLSGKTNQSDHVLAYLKASVSTCSLCIVGHTSVFLLLCVLCHHEARRFAGQSCS